MLQCEFFNKSNYPGERLHIYFSSKREFTSAIKEFFDVTLPEVADSLVSRVTDNFQLLKPAS